MDNYNLGMGIKLFFPTPVLFDFSFFALLECVGVLLFIAQNDCHWPKKQKERKNQRTASKK